MRVFQTATISRTDAILRDGFIDMHRLGEIHGVHCADVPLGVMDGFEGDVTLCVEVPDEVFQQYECKEDGCSHRYALIPAAVLNSLGQPDVYDCAFAGLSRRDMVESMRRSEEARIVGGTSSAAAMRRVMEFFDRIGWRTLLRPREESLPDTELE
jgi:hypothetical protein